MHAPCPRASAAGVHVLERKGHPETIVAGPGGSNPNFSLPARASLHNPKDPFGPARVLPAPRRRSPPHPRRPGPSAATRPKWGGERGLGFAAREIVLEILNGRKLFPVHLRSWEGLERARRSPMGPRNAEPGTRAPSWVLPVPGRGRPAPFPNAPPKMGERAPPRANGELLEPEQRMRQTESTRQAGPAPGRGPVPLADKGALGRLGPGGVRSLLRCSGAAVGRHPAGNVEGGGRGADLFAWFRAGRCLVGREWGRDATPALTVCLCWGFKPFAPSEGGNRPARRAVRWARGAGAASPGGGGAGRRSSSPAGARWRSGTQISGSRTGREPVGESSPAGQLRETWSQPVAQLGL